MSNFAPTRNEYNESDRRWARNFLALDTHGVTLDASKFPAGTVVPSGTHIGKADATTKMSGPRASGQPSVGLLVNDFKVTPGKHLVAVASGGGPVDRRYLPAGHDDAAEKSLTAINFIN